MNSYLFIEALFKNVLAESKTIKGRFYLCPKGGQEIDTDLLEQVLKDNVKAIDSKTYPLALGLPPASDMTLKDDRGEWERYTVTMFFLTTSFYISGTIKKENKSTGTSTQPIPADWDQMKQCAKDFILILSKKQQSFFGDGTVTPSFRLLDQEKKLFDPVTLQGNDGASGVRLIFKIDVWTGCVIEDYEDGIWSDIEIPTI